MLKQIAGTAELRRQIDPLFSVKEDTAVHFDMALVRGLNAGDTFQRQTLS